ncbi:MAG: PEP-CTERM sorting domain-containing protein [Gammaproteobacteria bacterium]
MSVSEANADGYVSNVGFNENGGDPLEYLFNVTGGDASDLFGETFGVILMGSGFPIGGDIEFDGDWTNDGLGMASIGGTLPAGPPVVPVPAAVWLFGSGLVALFGLARRKKMP